MIPEELKEHCSIGCAECHRIMRAINPKFKPGDIVELNSPGTVGHGMQGEVIGDSRCELLNSNIYNVKHENFIIGYHEKDNSLIFKQKQAKLTDFEEK